LQLQETRASRSRMDRGGENSALPNTRNHDCDQLRELIDVETGDAIQLERNIPYNGKLVYRERLRSADSTIEWALAAIDVFF